MDEALKIYPAPADGGDIRPQISVSDIECRRGSKNQNLVIQALFHCSLY